MRALLALAAIALGVALGTPGAALASCAALSVDQRIASADAIAYGTIDRDLDPAPFYDRTFPFRVERVFKGSLPAVAFVRMGPEVSSAGPLAFGATSVDYRGRKGDHVLYLRLVGGGFETNDCSGSHSGALTPEERPLLGDGSAPRPASLLDEIAARGVLPFLAFALVALIALATLSHRARRGA